VRWSWLAILALACEGPVGPPGVPGPPGPPGPRADAGSLADAGRELPEIPLEPDGLVGRVIDTSGAIVSGRVVIIPASDVGTIGATALDLTIAPDAAAMVIGDEPIEDLIDTHPEYSSAALDAGVYRFAALPIGEVFVVVVPESDAQLPGGELARAARDASALVGRRVDLRVSTRPSSTARAIGSDACVSCHGLHRAYGTAHFASLRVPRRPGYEQELDRFARADEVLDRFEEGATLYFYDCDPSAVEDACAIAESPPPAPAVVSFEVVLGRDSAVALGEPGAYRATVRDRRGTGEVSYPIDLVYGGLIYGAQLIARTGEARHALPFQYAADGDPASSFAPARRWRDVSSATFYDHTAGVLRTPASEDSFDRQCASCHFAGYTLDDERASAIATFEGAFDYDGDGRREQLDPGCEGCHGPGSDHVDAGGRGVAIVSPALLTTSRADAICGTCHAREHASTLPGDRRAALVASLSDPELDPGDVHASGDPRRSRLQYAAHVQTRMHRAGAILVACSDCHDPHGTALAHDLRAPADDNSGCVGCHNEPEFRAPRMHVEETTGDPHAGLEQDDFVCTLCHMPPTASGGAMQPGLFDDRPPPGRQYWLGDLASHGQRVSGFDDAELQPASAVQPCAVCHSLTLP
jgi:predicted CXXCH cytochrome family protein